ncbi:MAG: ion transporter [Myxococcales bacterium]|nr:ion transporter [Myxococcales bacterium]
MSDRRPVLERLVDERLVMGVILFNLAVIFVRGFPSMAHLDPVLFGLDYACLLYFFLEMVAKIRLRGLHGFWARAINRFDFVLVVASAPTLISPFTDVDEVALVLVFRAARVLRFLRVLRFIPHADQLWRGVMRALRASVGFIIALALYNMVLGLIGAHLFSDVAPEHFGDPLRAIYTMFKVFTVEGWFDIPEAIALSAPEMGTAAKAFFVFVVLTGGILGFSIANAVFVDEMVMDNNSALERNVHFLASEIEKLRAENEALIVALGQKVDRLLSDEAAAGAPPPDDR